MDAIRGGTAIGAGSVSASGTIAARVPPADEGASIWADFVPVPGTITARIDVGTIPAQVAERERVASATESCSLLQELFDRRGP